MTPLKRVAAMLPGRWQDELKRIYFARQIRRGAFETDEPEFKLLARLVRAGDWAVDVGANVGHYAKRLSDLVGPEGRVFAFEPVPSTFALLAANVRGFQHSNVTLINAALSDGAGTARMAIPDFTRGLPNFYQARLSAEVGAGLAVVTLALDQLDIAQRVSLVKVDVEGHEERALRGMRRLIEVQRPVLIVETSSEAVVASLVALGYAAQRLPGSSNVLFTYGLAVADA
jgi:FkbM family methyltransferase